MRKSLKISEENLNSDSSINNREEKSAEVANRNPESTYAEIFDEPPIKVMTTLPKSFKSLVDIPIDITNENRTPQNIIALLGDALGVSDYEKNMASFWFLDFIALEILKYEAILDSHGRSLMVSWLAGEMKLIRDGNLSREAFFQKMEEIFDKVCRKISRGYTLQHWDLMSLENLEKVIPIDEDMKDEAKESEELAKKKSKNRISSKTDKKGPAGETRRKLSESSFSKRRDESENNINADEKNRFTFENNSHKLLDVIMEATYSMYGDNFHYALIVAAFVKPVIMHEYILPFTLRGPRPIKIFDMEKDKKKKIENGNGTNKKTKDTKKNKKNTEDATDEVDEKPQTPIKLTEDEILAKAREFILPLMESNEASGILENYKHENSQKKNIPGSKKKL